MINSRTRITLKTHRLVKLGIMILVLGYFLGGHNAFSQDESDALDFSDPVDEPGKPLSQDVDSGDPIDFENPPDIEAKTYPLKTIRKSKSNSIYLFDNIEDSKPTYGRILLLNIAKENYMAFRVLKLYPDKQFLAAKKVRVYNNHEKLEDGQSFIAIEKISDLAPPKPTQQDQDDLNELESNSGLEPSSLDVELDGPPSSESNEALDEDKKPTVEDWDPNEDSWKGNWEEALTVEEIQPMDPFQHWLMAGFGYTRNITPSGSSFFSNGNLRYGITIKSTPFLNKNYVQDSFAIDTGFYLYKGLSLGSAGDSYTVTSVVLNLRYNIMTSRSFTVFFYGGVIKGIVFNATSPSQAIVDSLSSILPSVGGGFIFQLGPQWFARVDAGLDALGLSLVLRF